MSDNLYKDNAEMTLEQELETLKVFKPNPLYLIIILPVFLMGFIPCITLILRGERLPAPYYLAVVLICMYEAFLLWDYVNSRKNTKQYVRNV